MFTQRNKTDTIHSAMIKKISWDALLKRLFWLTLAISCIVVANVLYRRITFESANKQVELVVSYREMRRLAHLNGISLDTLLPRLKDEGKITSIAIEEETVLDFLNSGKATLRQGSEILDMFRMGGITQGSVITFLYTEYKIDPLRYYFIVEEKENFERLKRFLEAEFGTPQIRAIDRHNVVEVLGEKDDLLTIGLGIPEEIVNQIKPYGFGIIPRLSNTTRLSEETIRQKLQSLRNIDFVNTLIFDGPTVLGYPTFLPYLHKRLTALDIQIGFIEFTKQTGIHRLAKQMPKNVFRVHSTADGEIDKLSTDQAVARYVRATKERGNLILFLKPYQTPPVQTQSLITHNLAFFRQVHDTLSTHGFIIGKIRQLPLSQYAPLAPYKWIIMSFGILSVLLALLNTFTSLSPKWVISATLTWSMLNYLALVTNNSDIWIKTLALLTATLVPIIAIITQQPKTPALHPLPLRIYTAVSLCIRACAIAIAGGLYIAALLSDIRFMVGVDQFFGVKISFVLPLFILGIFFFLRPHRLSAFLYVFRRLFLAPVRTVFLIAGVFCILFIFVYLARSGNNSLQIPIYETWLRNTLENVLFIRPRTKEFLIGYPCLIIASMYISRSFFQHWLWFFNVLGAVALVSVINSFCHVHTPVLVSVYRSLLGVIFGIICGLGYIAIFSWLKRGMKRFL